VPIVIGAAFTVLAAGSVLAEAAPAPQAHHSAMLIVLTGLLALVIVTVSWPVIRFSISIAHEGGHALFASVLGGTVKSVHLAHRKNGNLTTYSGTSGLATFVTTMMGYLSPSMFGLIGALLLVHGATRAVLWLSLLFLAILLLQVAHLRGALIVVAVGAVIFLFARYGSDGAQTVFAFTWIWFLLIGGFRHVVYYLGVRRAAKESKKPDKSSDGYRLKEQTHIPAPLWVGFFWLATLAALVLGAAILLGVVAQPAG
jgi:glucose-6-phosphate-specific signal transduction histidine kinase